jgi:hypothetical protein
VKAEEKKYKPQMNTDLDARELQRGPRSWFDDAFEFGSNAIISPWLGIATRTSLLVHGLIYLSLSFGLILINESAGVAWLAIHLLLVVAALGLASHNRFALTKRW